MLFIYLQGKIKFSHCIWSIWFLELLFLFLLSKIKTLFFRLWTRICQILHVIFESTSATKQQTPLYFFSSNIVYFGQTLYTFWDFRVLRSKFLKFLMSILNWQVDSSSIFASLFTVMTHNSPINFKLIHFQLWTKKKDPIKVPILRLSSALVKIYQIPHVIFGSTSQFSFKFCINLNCHQT